MRGSERNASHLLVPTPSPKRTLLGCPGSPLPPPGPARPSLRSSREGVYGRALAPALRSLPVRAPPVPPRPRFPSATPSRAPRQPFSPPESCFHGSLGRPLLTNSLSSPVPIPPPLGTSLRRSPSGSHHTPTSDVRLREARGRRERNVARSGPRGCVRGPWGPETTSPTRLPGAPVAIHPRLGRRLAPLSALSPSPCLPDSHPSPAVPGLRLPVAPAGPLAPRLCQLFARPPPLALAPQLPVPLARPVLSLQFALSKHCPGHVSQQQPTHRSSLPPRRPPRRAPGCYGNAPRAPGR
ncbi:uncharacterized protein [Kogia breviceps]|uniref:uncharacterized protein n=1 Tax=Kogia breviceps TaxID=27615 RepID=UPI0034D237BB